MAIRGHTVELVGTHLDSDIIEELHQSRHHPKLPAEIPAGVNFSHHLALGKAIEKVDLVVVGVNSLGDRMGSRSVRIMPKTGNTGGLLNQRPGKPSRNHMLAACTVPQFPS